MSASGLTRDERDTIAHEARHAAIAWVLVGRRGVRSISRLPDGHNSGLVQINTEDARPFDLACIKLAPFVAGMNRGIAADWRDAWRLAEMAYDRRPDRENVGESWGDNWMRTVIERVTGLLADSRVKRLITAVEGALVANPAMNAFEVHAVLRAADPAESTSEALQAIEKALEQKT